MTAEPGRCPDHCWRAGAELTIVRGYEVDGRTWPVGGMTDPQFGQARPPPRPPRRAQRVVSENAVDSTSGVERPERIRFCRKAKTRQDRAANEVAHPVDGVSEGDSEAALRVVVGHGRDPADVLANETLMDAVPEDFTGPSVVQQLVDPDR